MKKNYILLFFLLCFFNIKNICGAAFKNKSNRRTSINGANNEFRKKNHKKNFSKRKLDGSGNFHFVPLKIFLDTAELEYTCSSLGHVDIIVKAMNNAKDFLEGFIQIKIDTDTTIDIISTNTEGEVNSHLIKQDFKIDHYDPMFDEENIQLNNNNYFIFGKCVESLDDDKLFQEESASIILDFTYYVPDIGIVLLNKRNGYIDESKFTEDNLTNLMLHHFIRLLGFNSALVDSYFHTNYIPQESEDEYYLKTEGSYNFDNVINYAIAYFDCSNIERINLYVDNENLDSEEEEYYQYAGFDLKSLYWPKEIFAGELLTKYDYSEKKVLSGITYAFLDSLSYLKVTKDYNGDITRFKNNGCERKCNYFDTGVYAADFWDCTVCMDGFFSAIKSSESDYECVSNDNKDYYFLYNEGDQIYKKCESAIANCQKCSSQTICTLCKRGYELEDKDGTVICEKEEDDDDGLSTGAIIGIVFGCIGFLLIVALIIICLLKRRNKENEGEIVQKDEEISEKKDGEIDPKNVQDLKGDDVKIMEYSKNNEIVDTGAEIKKDNANYK